MEVCGGRVCTCWSTDKVSGASVGLSISKSTVDRLQPAESSTAAMYGRKRWKLMFVLEVKRKQPGLARLPGNQPDLRRNSSPDTASITIGGSA